MTMRLFFNQQSLLIIASRSYIIQDAAIIKGALCLKYREYS